MIEWKNGYKSILIGPNKSNKLEVTYCIDGLEAYTQELQFFYNEYIKIMYSPLIEDILNWFTDRTVPVDAISCDELDKIEDEEIDRLN